MRRWASSPSGWRSIPRARRATGRSPCPKRPSCLRTPSPARCPGGTRWDTTRARPWRRSRGRRRRPCAGSSRTTSCRSRASSMRRRRGSWGRSRARDDHGGSAWMTTRWWRKAAMLRKLVSLVGGLVAAPLGAGCTKADLEGRKFRADISITPEQIQELTGKPSLAGTSSDMLFEDTLTFSRIDETVDVTAYMTVDTGEIGVRAGKFTTRATLRKGYTGGPPGSATELFVEG